VEVWFEGRVLWSPHEGKKNQMQYCGVVCFLRGLEKKKNPLFIESCIFSLWEILSSLYGGHEVNHLVASGYFVYEA